MLNQYRTYTPLRSTLVIISSIVAVELLIHVLFHLSKAEIWMSETARITIHVLSLAIVSSFAVFFWVFRPLKRVEQQALSDKVLQEKAVIQANEERAKTESILAAIGDAISIQDKDFKIVYQNTAHKNIIGEHVGEYCYKAYENNEQPCDGCGIARSIKDGGIYTVERSAPTDHGTVQVEITTSPLRDSSGTIIAGIEVARDITERKRVELALKNHEAQLAESQRIAHIGSFERNILTHEIQWSDETYRLFGYDPLTTKPSIQAILNAIHPDDREKFTKAILEANSGEMPYNVDYRVIHTDGSETVIHALGEVIRDASGKPNLIRGTVQDITERKQWEQALKNQRHLAEAAVQNSAVATFVLDADHRIVVWNKACEALTGHSAASLIGTNNQWLPFYDHKRHTLADIIIDHNIQELPALYPNYSPSELVPNGLHAENWFPKLNGKERYIIFDASPILDANGKLMLSIETLQDITESKRAEEKIRQSKQDWEDTFNTITDMVTIHDKDFNIIGSNKAAEQLLNLPVFDNTLKKCYRYYHGTECAPKGCPSCASLITGQPTVSEMFEPHLNKFIEIRAIPRLSQNNQMVGLIHVVRDITEHKKLEEQLFQAQKMEAVGQLAGGVAHDFNNILTAILGDAYILGMRLGAQSPLATYVDDIRISSEKAAALTQSLLTFSRKQIINPKPMDLNATVQKMQKLMSRIIGEDISLQTVQMGAELTVMADGGQLEQVLMNLITNARDAMPQGGKLTISTSFMRLDDAYIRTHGYGKTGPYALLSVADTGIGMDESTRDRVFEPFFTTKEVGKGTGLGLSIVYGIVKQHEGFIDCLSAPGAGTTFNIYLPLAESKRIIEDETNTNIPKRGKESVLLAEDDPKVRKATKAILEEFGYTVIEAMDGDDAVQKFNENRDLIQLIIMDVIMPGKNGKETYEEIKTMNPAIKTLFLSGYSNDIIHKSGILDEKLNFLPKPSAPFKLLSKIREILDR